MTAHQKFRADLIDYGRNNYTEHIEIDDALYYGGLYFRDEQQQRRERIATQIYAGMFASGREISSRRAVESADALIKELDK